jgi:superfamily II RNA helicase
MPSVFRWASGEDDWAAIVEESFGGHEGDLIRAMRRLIDVLRQLAEASEVDGPLAALLGRAARLIDRASCSSPPSSEGLERAENMGEI